MLFFGEDENSMGLFIKPFVLLKDGGEFLEACTRISHNEDFQRFDVHSYELNTLVLAYKATYLLLPSTDHEGAISKGLKRDLAIINPFIRNLVIDRVLVKTASGNWATREEGCDGKQN